MTGQELINLIENEFNDVKRQVDNSFTADKYSLTI